MNDQATNLLLTTLHERLSSIETKQDALIEQAALMQGLTARTEEIMSLVKDNQKRIGRIEKFGVAIAGAVGSGTSAVMHFFGFPTPGG